MSKAKKVTVKNPPTVEHIYSDHVKAVVWQNAGEEDIGEPAILIESWGDGELASIRIMQGSDAINLNVSTLQAMPEILAEFARRHKWLKEQEELRDAARAKSK